ncbi:ABC transporter ATP-binding protein [Staphylococcus gallinarum]|uniref:ABC transporter ATP-binding protein n=1 Tax=Staphylococcus gallinarum TaxID=1293 RepID=UPI0030C1E341
MFIRNVNKTYNKNNVLNNITFNIKNENIVGLVGKNGAGKTTLLKILNGNMPIYRGEVSGFNDKKIASIIEKPKLYENKTGRFNLTFFLKIQNQVIDWEFVEHLINDFQMENYINRKVNKYSMGMKQLLSLIIAMSQKPDLLILDEPTNGMDAKNTQKVLSQLTHISQKYNMVIIITSHKLEEIEQICERVLIMENGNLIKDINLKNKLYTKRISLWFLKKDLNDAIALIESKHRLINTKDSYIECEIEEDYYSLLKDLGMKNIYPLKTKEYSYSLKEQYLDS